VRGRVAVSYSDADAGFGGRLRDDLVRRMPRAEVVRAAAGSTQDVLVAVIGTSSLVPTAPDDRVRRDLVAALAANVAIVLVAIDPGGIPTSADLPPELSPLGALDPVRASDDYWDAALERIIERINKRRALPRSRLAALSRASRRLRIGAAVSVVGGVLGILATLGAFSSHPPEGGSISVSSGAANGLTFRQYVAAFAGPSEQPQPYSGPIDMQGYVYDIKITLENPEGSHFGVRWTERDTNQKHVIAGQRDVLAELLAPQRASGAHHIWVPCPPLDSVAYIVEFSLVDESAPQKPPLDSAESQPGSCRILHR
jgi:hypothetical protein